MLQIDKKIASLTNTLNAFEAGGVMSAVQTSIAEVQTYLHKYAEITPRDLYPNEISIKTKYLNWLKTFPGPSILDVTTEHNNIVNSIKTLKTHIEGLSNAIRIKESGEYVYSSDTFNYVDQFINYCQQMFDYAEEHYERLDSLYAEQATAGLQLGDYTTSFTAERDEFIENNANKYCIYWYRYEDGYVDNDSYYVLGNGWKKLPNDARDQLAARSPDVIAIYEDYAHVIGSTNIQKQPCYQKIGDCNLEWPTTQFKAVLFYNHVPHESGVLTFINQSLPEEELTITDGIYIDLDDNAMDIYPVYNVYYTLLNSADAYVDRKLRVRYIQSGELRDDLLAGCSTVYWYLPNAVSQLVILDEELCKAGFTNVDRFVEKLLISRQPTRWHMESIVILQKQ